MTSEPPPTSASPLSSTPPHPTPPNAAPERAYVWVWLPGALEPVVAGIVQSTTTLLQGEAVLLFAYARSYLDRSEKISLFTPELPLTAGPQDPRTVANRTPTALAGCLRDAAPDAWGRRVIGLQRAGTPEAELSELTYLLTSGSDRIGALDFQEAHDHYVSRGAPATLEELLTVTTLVEEGRSVPASLAAAAQHGTSIGGARPKALLDDDDRQLVAKFSSSTDGRPVVKAEGAAMLLAARAGLQVAPVRVMQAGGRDVLLVERFDRVRAVEAKGPTHGTGRGPTASTRRAMVSMLTVVGTSEMSSRHVSYAHLADTIRTGPWTDVPATLRELYSRLILNVFVGNNDDHLRNHAAFWDGAELTLTPAYDVCPQPRSTSVSSQAIGITRDGRRASQLWLCREVARDFLITPHQAEDIIDQIRTTMHEQWDEVCDEVQLTTAERQLLWGREFNNAYLDHRET